jgi:hypothetical protein
MSSEAGLSSTESNEPRLYRNYYRVSGLGLCAGIQRSISRSILVARPV